MVLDSKLTFNEHINHILSKVNKSIGLLRKFQSVLPRSSLLTVYKIFIRSHLDYADVVYRSSHRRCSVKKGSLGNFAKFTGTHLRQRLFFIKKESLAQVFSGEFCEISKNTGRLLLCSWPKLQVVVSRKTWVDSIQCYFVSNRCFKRIFFWKTLLGVRLRVSSE